MARLVYQLRTQRWHGPTRSVDDLAFAKRHYELVLAGHEDAAVYAHLQDEDAWPMDAEGVEPVRVRIGDEPMVLQTRACTHRWEWQAADELWQCRLCGSQQGVCPHPSWRRSAIGLGYVCSWCGVEPEEVGDAPAEEPEF